MDKKLHMDLNLSEKLIDGPVVNQICVDKEGKSAVIKRVFMPNLDGVSVVEFKYVKTAQIGLLPLREFKKVFS